MIPKIIHYCWFGRGPMPELAQRCIESWKKFCPDYEIVAWNEDTFNIEDNPYVQEAYTSRKYAFVTDFVRLYALNQYGGVYMDTDVELLAPIDEFLSLEAFSGFESKTRVPTGLMASEKGTPLLTELLAYYDNRHFILEDGSLDLKTNIETITSILEKHGLQKTGTKQTIAGLTLFPSEYFCPKDCNTKKLHLTPNSKAIHHFDGSWVPVENRIWAEKHRKLSRFFGARIAEYILVLQKIYHEVGFTGIIKKLFRR